MKAWVIAELTLREAARRRVLWAALLLGLAFLALYGLGLQLMLNGPGAQATALERREGTNALLMVGLYAVDFLMVMMIVLTSVDTLPGEISTGVIQSLAVKPLKRWEVVVGKWLGFAAMLTVYVLLMAGGVLVLTYILSGYTAHRILAGLALMWMEGLLLLSMTVMWGTRFSALTTGVLTFGFHGLAFIGGWIEEFGALAHSQAAVKLGVLTSLIMPSEVLWRRAAVEMQSPLVNAIGASPFSNASVTSATMIVYAGLYLVTVFSLAVRLFGRKDL